MSEVQQPVVVSAPAVESAAEPLVAPTATEAPTVATTAAEPSTEAAPVLAAPAAAATTEPETAATTETAPVVADAAAETVVEPITEGQLAYKGPGLVKSLIPSKKEFWLSDAAVESQNLDLFLRGEKPEVAHPIAAWATQTGKGLLFFNKKGDTDRTHPADILPLYEATDLKKEPTHQFAFKIGTSTHTFKATSDAERDGWYLSIEKSIELSKASKEEVQGQESYKSEVEKLAAPVVAAGALKTKKTESEETEKKQKSRSTSRGLLGRLKGNKEETAEEKKEEEIAAEETKAVEPVAAPTGEIAPLPVAVPAETAAEETPAVAAAEEERPKPAKRQSIFGKFNIGGLKSPSKEKEQKEVEAAAPVSENPPVLPETATTEPTSEVIIPVTENPTVPGETAAVPAEAVAAAPTTETTTSPTKERSNFLSSFIKRSRSVSPSAALKDEPKLDEVASATPTTTAAVEEPVVVAAPTEEPAVAAAEPTTEEATTKEPAKRESVLGSLGRRASKAFKGINAPKKESTATSPVAATEATKEEEETAAATTTAEPVTTATEDSTIKPAGETVAIADVVPEAVSVGQPAPTVAASA